MDNTRVEQLISKDGDTSGMMMKALTVFGAVALSFICLAIFSYFGLVLVFFVIYFAYYVFKMTDVEYEYLLVNNELSIDVIYGKQKRKQCCVYNVREAEIFAPINSDRVHNYLHNQNIEARNYSSGREDANVYVLVVNSESKMYKLFIEPNEKLFEGIKYYIPRKTYTE